eukprot:767240-Hanusia_phi.AAC.4
MASVGEKKVVLVYSYCNLPSHSHSPILLEGAELAFTPACQEQNSSGLAKNESHLSTYPRVHPPRSCHHSCSKLFGCP